LRGCIYEDAVVKISWNGREIEVTRKENRNPVAICLAEPEEIMKITRWHGEVSCVIEHVSTLCEESLRGRSPELGQKPEAKTKEEPDMADVDVRVGDVWKDLDPRAGARLMKVLALEEDKAVVQHPTGQGTKRKVRLDRMRSRGTRGYKLVERDGQPVEEKPESAAA